MTTLLEDPDAVGEWKLVAERSSFRFASKSLWGLLPVTGCFTEFIGQGQIVDTRTILGRIEIRSASLNTHNRQRDSHLRSAQFFDVAKFPRIGVVVTNADTAAGNTLGLRAQLTVKNVTRPLTLTVEVERLDDGGVRFTTQTTIDRTDFGVGGPLLGMVVDATVITADMTFRRSGR